MTRFYDWGDLPWQLTIKLTNAAGIFVAATKPVGMPDSQWVESDFGQVQQPSC